MLVFFASGLVAISAADLKEQSNPILQLQWIPLGSPLLILFNIYRKALAEIILWHRSCIINKMIILKIRFFCKKQQQQQVKLFYSNSWTISGWREKALIKPYQD